MKKIFVFAIIALSAVAVASCAKDNNTVKESAGTPLVLGFENWTDAQGSENIDSKTFLNNGSTNSPEIYWADNNGMDRVLWVFQASTGTKRKYVSSATDISATRSFTPDSGVPDLVANRDIAYALWTGKSGQDNAKLENGKITSNGSLVLNNPQTLNKSQSFEVNTNIAVAKPSDTYLKNVFGYIRFVNPKGSTNHAKIKSITFHADENLAGQIEIDYSGDEPVASIIQNDNASKYLTVNARQLTNGSYESGTWYACLVPGTYHHFQMTVTAFEDDGTSADAATLTPFTVNGGTVIIERSKWTNAGTLPTTDPNAIVWPENQDAFDYGIAVPNTKTATLDHDLLAEKGWASTSSGNPGVRTTEAIVMDKVTYGADSQFITMGGSRPYINTCYSWSTAVSGYPKVPTNRYFSFKINRPGTLSFFPRYSNSNAEATLQVILDKKVNNARSLEYLYNAVPSPRTQDAPNASNRATYTISVPVTRNNLNGIDDAATIYVAFGGGVSAAVNYYDITWTPSE